jgi:hypothetical protein
MRTGQPLNTAMLGNLAIPFMSGLDKRSLPEAIR